MPRTMTCSAPPTQRSRTGTRSLHRPPSSAGGRVSAIAGEHLPAGARSPVVTTATPLDVSTVFWNEQEETITETRCALQVTVENKRMTSLTCGNSWMKHVQLSGNCHVQNVLIKCDAHGDLFLQTTREIRQMEPLYAWFSMEAARMFNIPFLTLQNIQGEQDYRCHQCGVIYRNPNPLKIHLAFFCKTMPDTLQTRSTTTTSLQHVCVSSSDCSQLPSPVFPSMPSTSTCTNVSPPIMTSMEVPSLCSAFGSMFGQTLPLGIPQSMDQGILQHIIPSGVLQFQTSMSNMFLTQPFGLTPRSIPLRGLPEAPTEGKSTRNTLRPTFGNRTGMSPQNGPNANYQQSDLAPINAGPNRPNVIANSAKRHHKCPYCGKLYSRKYGLKIHIRTHTGYKPLKCKVCLRPFGDPSNLNKHVRLHAEGVTPYRCDLCGKVLVRRRDLERHLKSRHPADTLVDNSMTNRDSVHQ